MPSIKQEPFVFTMKDGHKFTGYGESREEVLRSHLILGTKLAGHQMSREEVDDPNHPIILIDSGTFEYHLGKKFEEIAKDAYDAVFPPRGPKKFVFKMNDKKTRLTLQGNSEAEALMTHLVEKSKELGHQISFSEAENPAIVRMVHPSAFVIPFGEFDEAARTAWSRAH